MSVGGRVIAFTSLDKVMYPETGTTKRDVLHYYATVSEALVGQAHDRPATVRRFVEGVGTPDQPAPGFIQKDVGPAPPSWLATHSIEHSDRTTVYPMVNDAATLAWLVQRDALEIHTPQWRAAPDGSGSHPDRLVIDLDPGQGVGLRECALVARIVRTLLLEIGLDPWPVTSGSKGIHLYAGLDGSLTSREASEVAHGIARRVESDHPELVVSDMARSLRAGRVLIDWSQNSAAKTTVTPYSLRGRARPYVAAPRSWEELDSKDLRHLEMHDVMERVTAASPDGSSGPVAPIGSDSFLLQEHRTRRVHTDLRLHHAGETVCWMLPDGLPAPGGAPALAVCTDEWPVSGRELAFPDPERAGPRRVLDRGRASVHRWRGGEEVLVTLHPRTGGKLATDCTVSLTHTGSEGDDDDHWMIRLSERAPSRAPSRAVEAGGPPVAPMLAARARPREQAVLDAGWRFEMKWDGVRAIVQVDGGVARLWSRNGRELTQAFPDIAGELPLALVGRDAVVDGEIIALDADRRPDFELLQQRLGAGTVSARLTAAQVPVSLLLFDLVCIDGQTIADAPLVRRRESLEHVLVPTARIHLSPSYDVDLDTAVRVSRELGLEGVMAKRADSPYRAGVRSEDWLKVKEAQTSEALIAGWVEGASGLGSLVLAVPGPSGSLEYAGRVGSGLGEGSRQTLRGALTGIERPVPPISDVPSRIAARTHWVEPVVVAEVRHQGWTRAGRMRQPVWCRVRPDLGPADLSPGRDAAVPPPRMMGT